MNVYGIVFLYNPDKNIINNINSYASHIQKLYIADNSENDISKQKLTCLFSKNVQYSGDKINQGIAARLNEACKNSIIEGADFLLTMDQDSFFREDIITEYLNSFSAYPNLKHTAMIGINHSEKNRSLSISLFQKKNTLITSGSIINLNIYKQLSGFDENLFIDLVDTDYCFNALKAGYDIVEMSNIFMEHSIGNIVKKKSLKNFKVTNRSLHAPIRIYYMVRNFLYLKKKYSPLFNPDLKIYQADLFNRIKNNLIYNKKRGIVLVMIFRAIIDFYQNKMGKYSR